MLACSCACTALHKQATPQSQLVMCCYDIAPCCCLYVVYTEEEPIFLKRLTHHPLTAQGKAYYPGEQQPQQPGASTRGAESLHASIMPQPGAQLLRELLHCARQQCTVPLSWQKVPGQHSPQQPVQHRQAAPGKQQRQQQHRQQQGASPRWFS
jgi:hypothetical protein